MVEEGQDAPNFSALTETFKNVQLFESSEKVLIILALMSVDTPVCETIVRHFDAEMTGTIERASRSDDVRGSAKMFVETVEIWSVSLDLPFTLGRCREAANVKNVKMLSDFRTREFSERYGVSISTGIHTGIISRAVFVIGKNMKIAYRWDPKNLSDEPKYKDVIEVTNRELNRISIGNVKA